MSNLIKKKNIIKQLIWCMVLPVLFNLFALLGDVAIKPESLKNYIMPVGFFVLFFVLVLIYICIKLKIRKSEEIKIEKHVISKKDILFVLILLGITIGLRIPMYGTFQRWDAGEYFYRIVNACYEYDFTFDKFLNGFNICSHTNYGFSGLVGTFMFLAPYSYRVVNVLQMTCAILAIICLYFVLKKKWRLSQGRAFAGALMISMVPVYLGLSTYLAPDFFMFVFFVYALFFQTYGYHIAEGFMMIMLVFCKENCVLIVFGYYGVSILYTFFKEKAGFKDRIIRVLKSSSFWVAIATATAFLSAFFMAADKWYGDAGNSTKAFVYSRVYIIIRIKQMFFTHFTSIMTLVSLVVMFVIVFRIRKKLREKKLLSESFLKSLYGLMAAMAFICMMGIVFHIAVTARYDVFFVCCLGLYMIILLNILCLYYDKRKMSILFYVITGSLSFLFMIESYISMDPLARHWFTQLNLGKGFTISYESEYQNYMGDSLVYNYQYSWLDKAFDEMLRDLDYTEDKGVYLPFYQYESGSGLHLNGNSRFYRVAWDPVKKERCYYRMGDESVTPIYTYYIDDYDTYFPYKDLFYDEYIDNNYVPDKGVYTSVQYYSNGEKYLDRLGMYFYKDKKHHVDKGTGRLDYYKIYKKDSYNGSMSVDEIARKETDPTNNSSEEDLKIAKGLLNGEYDTFYDQVNELYNYKYGMNSEIIQIGVNERNDIQPMDSVEADFTVTDKDGNVIIFKDRISVTAGDVGLIDEVDSALLDMNVGEDRTIEYTVPEHTLGLEEYAGQTVYISIHIYGIPCIYENKLNNAQLENLYSASFDSIWNYYKKLLVSDIITKNREAYDNGETEPLSEEKYNEVKDYMSEYMAEMGFTEDEFLGDYAHISKQEYEKSLIILANSSDELDALYQELDLAYSAVWGN